MACQIYACAFLSPFSHFVGTHPNSNQRSVSHLLRTCFTLYFSTWLSLPVILFSITNYLSLVFNNKPATSTIRCHIFTVVIPTTILL
jgi:hypothetical protein